MTQSNDKYRHKAKMSCSDPTVITEVQTHGPDRRAAHWCSESSAIPLGYPGAQVLKWGQWLYHSRKGGNFIHQRNQVHIDRILLLHNHFINWTIWSFGRHIQLFKDLWYCNLAHTSRRNRYTSHWQGITAFLVANHYKLHFGAVCRADVLKYLCKQHHD